MKGEGRKSSIVGTEHSKSQQGCKDQINGGNGGREQEVHSVVRPSAHDQEVNSEAGEFQNCQREPQKKRVSKNLCKRFRGPRRMLMVSGGSEKMPLEVEKGFLSLLK